MARKKKNYEKYRKKNPEKEKRNKTFTIIIAAILVVMVLAQIGLIQERRRLEAEKTKIEKQISKEEERTKELKKTKKYMTTDEYIEKVAREKFGLFYPDEYVLEEE
ncbi:MAG: septum formation initiator family protein [Lachnospiraceae bacterium]|nr:septum formation initiator family protein [Lachnospiraceae bacterium]